MTGFMMSIAALNIAAQTPDSGGWHWKMILMLFFLGFWLAVAIWLLFTRKGKFDKQMRMPLEDDRVLEPRDGDETKRRGGG
jgi:cbb3-type cytochrome oxidase subunit 3